MEEGVGVLGLEVHELGLGDCGGFGEGVCLLGEGEHLLLQFVYSGTELFVLDCQEFYGCL